jgi:hypothetical protein
MPRRAWIVWMMFALLPLRGWAAAAMTLPAPDPVAPLETSVAAEATLAPCHESATTTDTGDVADAPTGEHNCLLCHLCHGAVAGLPAAPVSPQILPAPVPRIEAGDDTGRRLTGGLERPPRT